MPRSHLLAYPFRIFFLLTALFAVVVIAVWLGVLTGSIRLPAATSPLWWHAHEMLYGLVPGAVAGFLLTAMANWTGAPPPTGARLLGLAALWLAGRLAMALYGGVIPVVPAAIIDLAFLPALALVALRTLWRHGNRRNLPLVAVLAVFALGNLCLHLAMAGVAPGLARTGEYLALDLTAILMAVIGGRIIPAFSGNWLRRQGRDPELIRRQPRLDRAALLALVAVLAADALAPGSRVTAVLALVAAALHAARVIGWRGWHTVGDPLMWILHLGYAWIPVALLLKGLTPFVPAVPPAAWIHALGVGAIGTLILGVMTRVAVAHTARGLLLRPGGRAIYALITLAVLARLTSAATGATGALHLAGAAWIAAFGIFLVAYAPVLNAPRADGQPG
ncbi:NnrS family protein [Arhodomonas aquaeolei]|uniref:NnrS family protein n=1 Tax=Arhodomonas aquaeolei TaxID=2369 RepID=UPI00216A4374|nr:NnrS family protein [Arhodomonas aquaeolei]MCS4504646.1 NnrS family protein [Arhodomonas aquaeolei]